MIDTLICLSDGDMRQMKLHIDIIEKSTNKSLDYINKLFNIIPIETLDRFIELILTNQVNDLLILSKELLDMSWNAYDLLNYLIKRLSDDKYSDNIKLKYGNENLVKLYDIIIQTLLENKKNKSNVVIYNMICKT